MRDAIAYQREACFVRADGGFLLTIKAGIHQQELPSGRGLSSKDAVLPSVDVNVTGLIADRFQRCFCRSQPEVGVRDEAVLRDVEANSHSLRVAFIQLE